MKKAKMYLGSPPGKDTNFTLCSLVTFEGVDWKIYEDVESSPKWYFYKIVACKPVKSKGNYSLAYAHGEKRLTGKDLLPLAQYRRGLLRLFAVKADIQETEYFGQSFSNSIDEMLEQEC